MLTPFNCDTLGLVYINSDTHECFITRNFLARLIGVDEDSIDYQTSKLPFEVGGLKAEIPTVGGNKVGGLIGERVVIQMLKHYSTPSRYVSAEVNSRCNEILSQFAEAGIRVYLHHLAGYELRATVKPDTTELDKQIELAREQSAMLDKQAAIARLDYAKHLESIEEKCRQRGDLQAADFTKATIMRLQTVVVPSQSGGDTGSPALPSRPSEGAVDVAIRLGYSVPPNLEGALGKYVKDKCGHLILGFKDIRYAPVSGKNVPANQYPNQHPEVEQAVKDYLIRKNLIN
jgi:hypothetical protein